MSSPEGRRARAREWAGGARERGRTHVRLGRRAARRACWGRARARAARADGQDGPAALDDKVQFPAPICSIQAPSAPSRLCPVVAGSRPDAYRASIGSRLGARSSRLSASSMMTPRLLTADLLEDIVASKSAVFASCAAHVEIREAGPARFEIGVI